MGFGRAFGRVFGCWNPQRHRKSSTYGIQSRDRNAKVPANVTLSESDSRSVRSYLIDSVSFVSEAPSRSIHFDEWSYSVKSESLSSIKESSKGSDEDDDSSIASEESSIESADLVDDGLLPVLQYADGISNISFDSEDEFELYQGSDGRTLFAI